MICFFIHKFPGLSVGSTALVPGNGKTRASFCILVKGPQFELILNMWMVLDMTITVIVWKQYLSGLHLNTGMPFFREGGR